MQEFCLWELGGSEWILQVFGDNGEVWGGYGGQVRSVALASTRDCSGFDPLVFRSTHHRYAAGLLCQLRWCQLRLTSSLHSLRYLGSPRLQLPTFSPRLLGLDSRARARATVIKVSSANLTRSMGTTHGSGGSLVVSTMTALTLRFFLVYQWLQTHPPSSFDRILAVFLQVDAFFARDV